MASASSRTVNINVLKKHITEGKWADGAKCMVALALAAKGYENINVGTYDVAFKTKSGRFYDGSFPAAVSRKIIKFDSISSPTSGISSAKRTTKLKPFSFKMKVVRAS
jgi:hypothetical protein